MKKTVRAAAAAAAGIVLAAAAVYLAGLRPRTEVSTETVERRDVENTVVIEGTITGRDTGNVYSAAGKKVGAVKVSEGDKVSKGDILCELVSISDEAAIEQAQLCVEDAEREYAGIKELFELGTAAEDDVAAAESALKQAELNLRTMKEGKSRLESPVSGTVTRVNTKEGKIPLSTELLFVIEDLDELQMELKVSDGDISLVKAGQTVRIDTPVQEDYVYGKVEKIALTGEKKSAGSSEMVVPVTVVLEDPGKSMMAGVTAEAEIIVASGENALSVPVKALLEETGGTYIYLVRDSRLVKKEVTVLAEGEKYAAISDDSGALEGDQVVLMPKEEYTDGLRVRLRK